MRVEGFIAKRLKFDGKLAMWASAISFFVIIIAVSVAAGFRHEIRSALMTISSDIVVSNTPGDLFGTDNPVEGVDSLSRLLANIPDVCDVVPTVYRAAIGRNGENIAMLSIKSTPQDSIAGRLRLPERLANRLELEIGDSLSCFFLASGVQIRKFELAGIYDSPLDADDQMVAFACIEDMREIAGLSVNEASALELRLDNGSKAGLGTSSRAQLAETALNASMTTGLAAVPITEQFGQFFDWLELIDYNVWAILALMILVAAFNMISGLLILLFRNMSTIGTLKALGMKNSSISGVFIRIAARVVGMGLCIGNAAAFLFCAIQHNSKFIKLDPENYFVSFVPVRLDLARVLMADAIAFVLIVALLMLPTLFISKIDPAVTVKAE